MILAFDPDQEPFLLFYVDSGYRFGSSKSGIITPLPKMSLEIRRRIGIWIYDVLLTRLECAPLGAVHDGGRLLQSHYDRRVPDDGLEAIV